LAPGSYPRFLLIWGEQSGNFHTARKGFSHKTSFQTVHFVWIIQFPSNRSLIYPSYQITPATIWRPNWILIWYNRNWAKVKIISFRRRISHRGDVQSQSSEVRCGFPARNAHAEGLKESNEFETRPMEWVMFKEMNLWNQFSSRIVSAAREKVKPDYQPWEEAWIQITQRNARQLTQFWSYNRIREGNDAEIDSVTTIDSTVESVWIEWA
jgi:hypothetical protein